MIAFLTTITKRFCILVPLLLPLAVSAEDGAPQICVGCHAHNGDSLIPEYPKLIGQKEQYLIKALKAYRSGERKHDYMQLFASRLTDEDIERIARFYSSH